MIAQALMYLLINITAISCNRVDVDRSNILLKKKLTGEWELIVEDNDQPTFLRSPVGIAFSDDSIEFFSGFFRQEFDSITLRNKHAYFGNFTEYRIDSDSIFIKKLFDQSWSYWKSFVNVKGDTLILAGTDTTEEKFIKLSYNLDSIPGYDQIVYSSSGCYGSCPILDFSLNQKGEFLFQGEGYTDALGFFEGKLTEKQTNFIFNKFYKSDILNIDENYYASHTDDQSITTTYLKGGKIIKTIHDYGMSGPNELVWAYIAISNAYKQTILDTISVDESFYPKLHYFSFRRDSLILPLEKSESFYLWIELRSSSTLKKVFVPKYELYFRRNYTYWGPDPNENRQRSSKPKSIKTDGRFYSFYFENDKTVTYDLSYSFIDQNFNQKDFRKPNEWE